jgi:glycosyltransferase involved in cell wall biosynthesis
METNNEKNISKPVNEKNEKVEETTQKEQVEGKETSGVNSGENQNSVKTETAAAGENKPKSRNYKNRNYRNRNWKNKKKPSSVNEQEKAKSENKNIEKKGAVTPEIKESSEKQKPVPQKLLSEAVTKTPDKSDVNKTVAKQQAPQKPKPRVQNQNQQQNRNKPQQASPKPSQPKKTPAHIPPKSKNVNSSKVKKPVKKSYPAHKKERNYFSGIKKVSVVIPLLNEEESLRILYNDIKKAISPYSFDYEIVFIDDGSTDNSLNIIRDLSRRDNKVHYFSFRKNYGKSAALHVGFKFASGDAVITMDADLQDDPAEIPNLLRKLSEGYDLVSGWKKVRHDPFIKRHSSRFFNYMTRLTSDVKIHDFNCGLKAYRKEVIKSVYVHGELHRYIPVLAGQKGFKITEIPVKHHPRRYGKTKFGISRFFKGFVDLLTILLITRYATRPLHLFGFIGTISFLIGFVIDGYLALEWLLHETSLSNRPLLLLGLLMMIVGVQLFAIGLLGELFVHKFRTDFDFSVKEQK